MKKIETNTTGVCFMSHQVTYTLSINSHDTECKPPWYFPTPRLLSQKNEVTFFCDMEVSVTQ